MKAKHALVLYTLGLCVELLGALFKIQHWGHADTFLIVATGLKVAGVLLFGYKLLTHPQVKEFLNW